MNVFVVSEEPGYQPGTLVGVFPSEVDATQFILGVCATHPHRYWEMSWLMVGWDMNTNRAVSAKFYSRLPLAWWRRDRDSEGMAPSRVVTTIGDSQVLVESPWDRHLRDFTSDVPNRAKHAHVPPSDQP